MEKYKRNRDKINWQDARIAQEAFHTHPYDPVVLEQVRDDIMKPRTCKEFLDWVDSHPHYDMVAEASSNYLRGTPRKKAVKQVGQIHTNFTNIQQELKEYVDKHEIDTNFETNYTEDWRVYDLQDQEQKDFMPFRHNSELDNQRKHGFMKQYQLIEVTISKHFDLLKKLDDALGIKWAKTDINYQPTSGMFPRHVDFLTTALKRAVEHDPEIANMMYDPIKKGPENWQLKRLIIPLDDWYPGQVFNFEEHSWSNWRAGQIIDFDWAHVRHWTANAGYSPRPLAKITGFIDSDHWLAKNEFKEFTL